ncbi:MAG TPA: hypothetical protein VMW54_04905 [Terriglobia bacterium]|nr:hypothetical protein [Terriglobia bacterium]
MGEGVLLSSLGYIGYVLEASLLVYLVRKGYARRLWEVVFYLIASLGLNGARYYTLHEYGLASPQYGYCYWATDLLLVLAAFVVVSAFFRRACSENEEMWRHVRVLLVTVLLLVLAISVVSLSHHKGGIFTVFIIQFQQNLYFACLVLNTLLYLLVVKMEVADDRLGMLSCGLGIQFAGPAACLALYYLTGGDQIASTLTVFLLPLCDAGMTLTWFYAVARVPRVATVSGRARASKMVVERAFLQP